LTARIAERLVGADNVQNFTRIRELENPVLFTLQKASKIDRSWQPGGVLEICSFPITGIWYAFSMVKQLATAQCLLGHAKFARFAVQRGYMLRHGGSQLMASNVVGSLQLTCAEAPLHKPR
jgi:hypothetical protein